MSCAKGRITLTQTTKYRLFADSGGFCQNPNCLSELFRDIGDTTIHIAEMAHIISAADDGPRANTQLTPEERGAYTNLILLCPTCHTVIDKAEEKYPKTLISEWKRLHKHRIYVLFGITKYNSRSEARKSIHPYLIENRMIFDQYGPMTDEMYNPESSMPRRWLSKIRTRIIPNNRNILAICDENIELLSSKERYVLELYRQHVDDFEAKHVGESGVNGIQFPLGMNNIFMDI